MLQLAESLKQFLVAVDPRLWPFTIAVVVGFVYWLWKLVHPASFNSVPSKLKALPGAVLAAALSGLTAPELSELILDTAIGSLTAGGGYEFIQRALHGSKQARVEKKEPL